MSKIGVSLKINVSKIQKERLFKGKNGSYLDATVFIDPDNVDEYGNNGMITQDVTKEERDSGTQGPILGNCKVFWKDDKGQNKIAPAASQAATQAPAMDGLDDDIPF